MNTVEKFFQLSLSSLRILKLNHPSKLYDSTKHLVSFLTDFYRLEKQLKAFHPPFSISKFYPCLHDGANQDIGASGHYFHQDLLVAHRIFLNSPKKHVDVGSKIDGFVAHVASFRKIEVLDIRDLTINILNIIFKRTDIMDNDFNFLDYCDSVSSLHVIEHLGLGRYGDTVDCNGHLKGLDNIYKMLHTGGKFYFSVPIGEQRIEFNAHRVFGIKYLMELFHGKYTMDSFSYVDDDGTLFENVPLTQQDIENNFSCHYGCGIFELTKI